MPAKGALHLRRTPADGECLMGETAKQDIMETEAGYLPVSFPKGGLLFLEGQSATGIFLLRLGTAKESMVSSTGRVAILRVVGPGVILGVAAVLTGTPHESTVETLEPCHADFLAKTLFLDLLKTSSHLGKTVASQLNRDCKDAYASVRCLGLSESVSGRLARLILHWAEYPMADEDKKAAKIRIRVILTREEIGQSMGTTRETVSRMLGEFQEKRWINMKGSVWTITNQDAIRHEAAL
ncbi:MAG: Crp/Fnr family transcriptional regulator [Candidatus Angelobacter sp.]